MRLEQFEYLMAIHETHSISLASQNLHVSQQNISKAIQNLENELETVLLQRSNHGTFLTAAGLIVLKHAQKIFYEISALKTEIHPIQNQNLQIKGTLSILYSNAFNMDYIATSIQAFTEEFPLVDVRVHQKNLAKLLMAIYNQEAEIGLITANDDFHLNSIIGEQYLQSLAIYPLSEDTLMAAVGHTSPFASQKSISINKLLKNRLIFLAHESDDRLEDSWLYHLLIPYGKPQLTMTTNTTELYLKAIADNVGIGFLSQTTHNRCAIWNEENTVLLPLRPTVALTHSCVLNNRQVISPITAAYLSYLPKQTSLF